MPTAKKSLKTTSRPSPSRGAKAKAIKAISPANKKGKNKTSAKTTPQTSPNPKRSATTGDKGKSDKPNKKKNADDNGTKKNKNGKTDAEDKNVDTTKSLKNVDTTKNSKNDATNASDDDDKDTSQQKRVPIDYEPIIAKAVADISAQAGSASVAVPLDEVYSSVKSSVDRLRFADISFFRAVERMLDRRQLDEVGASYHDCNEMMKDLFETDKDKEGGDPSEDTDTEKEDDDDEIVEAVVGGVGGKDKTKRKIIKSRKNNDKSKVKAFGAGYQNKKIRIGPRFDKYCEAKMPQNSFQSRRSNARGAHLRRLLSPELAKAFVDSDRARQHKKNLVEELAQKKKLLEETKARIEELESSMIDASDQVVESARAVEKAELNIPCQWNEMYLRLIEYRERFGHCLPLKRYAKDDGESELAEWCKEQRYIFTNETTKHRPSSVEKEGEESGGHLKDGNVPDGDISDGDAPDGDESDENKKIDAEIEGGDDVKEKDSSNDDLISRLTPLEKIRKSLLERIGFMWDFQEGLWQRFYQDLLDYKAIHGNCDVKGKRNAPKSALAAWVGRQRTANRARLMLKAGKKAGDDGEDTLECIDEETKALLIEGGIGISTQVESCKKYLTTDALTDEQFRLLVEAGFDFNPYGNSWDRRYQELLDYKEQHGDCLVPQQYPTNQSLAIWVRKQQEHYKLMQEGKKNPLNPERFELLQKIGFVFQRSARKPRKNKKMKIDDCSDGVDIDTSGTAVALPTDSSSAQVDLVPKKRGRPRGKKRKAEDSISNEVTEADTTPEQSVNVQDYSAGQDQGHYQVGAVQSQGTQLQDWVQQQSHQQQEEQQQEHYGQQRQQQEEQQQLDQQLDGDRQPEFLQRVVDSQNHRQWLNANNSQMSAPPRPVWGFTDQNVDNRFVASGMTTLLQQVGAAYGTGHGLSPPQDNLLPRQNNIPVTAPGQVGDAYENVDKQVFDPSLLYQ